MKQKEFVISVGEPWDFESMDGQNIIKGNVIKILDNNNLIFKCNHNVKIKGVHGNILILSTRYKKDTFSILPCDVTVNGGVLSSYSEELSVDQLKSTAHFVLIGSIKLL